MLGAQPPMGDNLQVSDVDYVTHDMHRFDLR